MNVAIISGSPRANAQSARVAQLINQRYFDNDAALVDLHTQKLPEWNGTGFKDETLKQVRSTLEQVDAIVAVVPEWHGMAPAALKNLFLWCGHKQLAHKPILLVAVSAGDGGAFVVSELRSSSYKNSRLVYLPEHVIIRHVESLWCDSNVSETESREDYLASQSDQGSEAYIDSRLEYATAMLKDYAVALKPLREKLLPQIEQFTNGMS